MTAEEAGESAGESSPATPSDATTPPEFDAMKRKFREALDRKRDQNAHANAEGAQATGKVHGTHGPSTGRRSFRRKSG